MQYPELCSHLFMSDGCKEMEVLNGGLNDAVYLQALIIGSAIFQRWYVFALFNTCLSKWIIDILFLTGKSSMGRVNLKRKPCTWIKNLRCP